MPTTVADLGIPIADMAASFSRSLRSGNRADATIANYNAAIRRLLAFLVDRGMPTALPHVRREHIESFMVAMLGECAPASAANHYRSLQQFFKYAVDEGEIASSPMARMKPPQVPAVPPPVLSEKDMQALLKTCAGRDFTERRDQALLLLLIDVGVRRAELAGLRLGDVDLDLQSATVVGKGSRPRQVPFGRRTTLALDRYLRARATHPHRGEEWFWLGREGRLTAWGIAQAVERRGAQAGVDRANLHRFRHTAAHLWLSGGGSENGAMMNFGWRSRQMLGRYGASAAAERARAEHKRISPADRL